MQTADELIDIDEAARILTLRPSTVRTMVRDRKLVPIHPAGCRRVRFLRSSIERLAGLRPAEAPDPHDRATRSVVHG